MSKNTFLAVKPTSQGTQLFSGLATHLPIRDWSHLQTNNSIIHQSSTVEPFYLFTPEYCPEYAIIPRYNLAPEYPNWSIIVTHIPENQRMNLLTEFQKPDNTITLDLLRNYQCEIMIHTDYIAVFEGVVPELMNWSRDSRLFSQKVV